MLSSTIRENGASSGPGVLAAYGYDNLGRRTWVTRGNGVTTAYDYDAALRLEEIAHDLAGSGADQTFAFTHNAAGQIVGRAGANASYEFTPPAPGTTVYADNGLNQYISVGGAAQSYDARGNLTTGSFGYDIFNRLISGPNSAALSYDPLGRLYETSATGIDATRFLYDGPTVIAEYDDEDELLRRYVHGPAIDEPIVWYEGEDTSDRRWLAADQLGSVIAVIDGAGDALDINSYGEYGTPGGSNAGRFQYTGQAWLPEVALYHYRARAYAPTLGRFMQTDPILFVGGMNLYAYVGNNPVNFIDPSGLWETSWSEGTRICTMYWYGETTETPDGGYTITVTSRHIMCFDRSFGGVPLPNGPIDPLAPLGPGGGEVEPGLRLPFGLCSVVEGTISSGLQVGGKLSIGPLSGGLLLSAWSVAATGGVYNGGSPSGEIIQRAGAYGGLELAGVVGANGRIGTERSTEGGVASIPELFRQPIQVEREPTFVGLGAGAAMGFGAEGRIGFFLVPLGQSCPGAVVE